jgi:hypothetical protein
MILSQLPIQKPLKVTIEPFRARRSDNANRRLWKLHSIAAEAVGCSAEELHEEMLCAHYGYQEVKMPSGHMRRIPLERSSTKDTAKFAKFMEFCETTYITELGVFLE